MWIKELIPVPARAFESEGQELASVTGQSQAVTVTGVTGTNHSQNRMILEAQTSARAGSSPQGSLQYLSRVSSRSQES